MGACVARCWETTGFLCVKYHKTIIGGQARHLRFLLYRRRVRHTSKKQPHHTGAGEHGRRHEDPGATNDERQRPSAGSIEPPEGQHAAEPAPLAGGGSSAGGRPTGRLRATYLHIADGVAGANPRPRTEGHRAPALRLPNGEVPRLQDVSEPPYARDGRGDAGRPRCVSGHRGGAAPGEQLPHRR